MSGPQTQIMYPEEPRSCCCRVTTGLRVVGVCEIIWLILVLFSTGYRICTDQYLWADFAIIPFLGFGFFASCQLFHAVDSTAPQSVIPYLVYKYIFIPLCILVLGLSAIYASQLEIKLNTTDEWMYYTYVGMAIFKAVVLVLGIVFLVIAHQGRGYLLRKAASMGQSSFNNQNYSIKKPTVIPANQAPPPPNAFCVKETM